jgi:hypothetical protein
MTNQTKAQWRLMLFCIIVAGIGLAVAEYLHCLP